jgi:hypothetical protein
MKVIIAFLSIFCFEMYSQNVTEICITYGESIQLGKVNGSANFTVLGEDTTVSLNGAEINSFVFSKPGKYKILIAVKEPFTVGDCNHASLPKQINVSVSRTKMHFDGDKMQFSSPITKNKDMEGTTLSIPVFIETFDGKPIILNNEVVNVAGIGSSLTAKLNTTNLKLSEGSHILTYTLSGKVSENAYLMFDFINSDGKTQSVAMHNPIQNQ